MNPPAEEPESMQIEEGGDQALPQIPNFPALRAQQIEGGSQFRSVAIPPHRLTPLKTHWATICDPIVSQLKLQVKVDMKTRRVLLRTCAQTESPQALSKAADFVHAFILGFDVNDAMALLRLDDLFIQSFDVSDVKTLHGDHLSRAIGRISGKDGRIKYAIENATTTRIVVADSKIHILGSFQHIKMATDSICRLIRGAPPSKVYGNLRNVAARANERF
eukprot:gnl/Trimastix_PCT/476.p1 GENE.gnl/Trimastix_PCT/476~~gnl/Trimastix_PCT/476.p1  ORF type:complete len:219 (-),score=38.54 gnl/Trimastix_PCT/476:354-1010(-)